MAVNPNDIIAIIKQLAKQTTLTSLMATQMAEQACCIVSLMARCERCQKHPATVKHRYVSVSCCDRCAAEVMVSSTKSYVNGCVESPDDPLNEVRSSLMNEHHWDDIENASRIRTVSTFVAMVMEYEGRESTVH